MIYLSGHVRPAILDESLGVILTPYMGNRLPDGAVWAADSGCFTHSADFDPEWYLRWLGKFTQKQRVHDYLKLWGSLCVADVPDALAYTCRNRISELRRDGVPIRTATCGWHQHEHPVARYYLEQPAQQEMAL